MHSPRAHTSPACATLVALLVASAASAQQVVISQVYGGGQSSGSPYRCDFVEVFNRGTATMSLAGFSLQYASAAGSTWNKVNLSGSLAPGQYLLIQGACGSTGADLPTPDVTSTIAFAAASAKVALCNDTVTLTGTCPSGASIVDFVGYGSSANCFEGAGPTGTLSATTAALRNSAGCADINSNSVDFSVGPPLPRNSQSPFGACNPVSARGWSWGTLKITYR